MCIEFMNWKAMTNANQALASHFVDACLSWKIFRILNGTWEEEKNSCTHIQLYILFYSTGKAIPLPQEGGIHLIFSIKYQTFSTRKAINEAYETRPVYFNFFLLLFGIDVLEVPQCKSFYSDKLLLWKRFISTSYFKIEIQRIMCII